MASEVEELIKRYDNLRALLEVDDIRIMSRLLIAKNLEEINHSLKLISHNNVKV